MSFRPMSLRPVRQIRPASVSAAAALLPLTLACTLAWAQTAPAPQRPAAPAAKPAAAAPKPAAAAPKPAAAAQPKPAAAPAKADDKTLALGGGAAGTGVRKPILTRDELRVCLNQEADIRVRIEKHDASRTPLVAEKDEVLKLQQPLKADLEALQASQKQTVEALNAKFAAHGRRVEKFNEEVKAFGEGSRGGPTAEQKRRALNEEQTAIGASAKALDAERTATSERLTAEVKAFNDKKATIDARIAEWNARNASWVDTNNKLDAERKEWVENCADRRYREEDEAAIKAGR
jgi:uncharacterized coiled-coil protein SlyX